jgi:hypothetical protein
MSSAIVIIAFVLFVFVLIPGCGYGYYTYCRRHRDASTTVQLAEEEGVVASQPAETETAVVCKRTTNQPNVVDECSATGCPVPHAFGLPMISPPGPSGKGAAAKSQLFGNWYYTYGLFCNSGGRTDNVPCNVSLEEYLKPIAETENTEFYLGTGFYPGPDTDANFGDWKNVECKPSSSSKCMDNRIINFGGWGCCPGAYGCTGKKVPSGPTCEIPGKTDCTYCNTDQPVLTVDRTKCLQDSNIPSTYWPKPGQSSTGPNCVWHNAVLANFTKSVPVDDIKCRGYTGVSFDIEGVAPGFDGKQMARVIKTYSDAGLKTIITVPGNGVKPAWGGMDWFSDAMKAADYVCLMYYALINDTECSVGIGPPSALAKSLRMYWSGPASRYKLDPSQIILGFSFGETTSPEDYLNFVSPQGKKVWPDLARGGITRWAEQGGNIQWGHVADPNTTKCCAGYSTCPVTGGDGDCECPDGTTPVWWCKQGGTKLTGCSGPNICC